MIHALDINKNDISSCECHRENTNIMSNVENYASRRIVSEIGSEIEYRKRDEIDIHYAPNKNLSSLKEAMDYESGLESGFENLRDDIKLIGKQVSMEEKMSLDADDDDKSLHSICTIKANMKKNDFRNECSQGAHEVHRVNLENEEKVLKNVRIKDKVHKIDILSESGGHCQSSNPHHLPIGAISDNSSNLNLKHVVGYPEFRDPNGKNGLILEKEYSTHKLLDAPCEDEDSSFKGATPGIGTLRDATNEAKIQEFKFDDSIYEQQSRAHGDSSKQLSITAKHEHVTYGNKFVSEKKMKNKQMFCSVKSPMEFSEDNPNDMDSDKEVNCMESQRFSDYFSPHEKRSSDIGEVHLAGAWKLRGKTVFYIQRCVFSIQVVVNLNFEFQTCVFYCLKENNVIKLLGKYKCSEFTSDLFNKTRVLTFRKKIPFTSGRPETKKYIWIRTVFLNNKSEKITFIDSKKFYSCSKPDQGCYERDDLPQMAQWISDETKEGKIEEQGKQVPIQDIVQLVQEPKSKNSTFHAQYRVYPFRSSFESQTPSKPQNTGIQQKKSHENSSIVIEKLEEKALPLKRKASFQQMDGEKVRRSDPIREEFSSPRINSEFTIYHQRVHQMHPTSIKDTNECVILTPSPNYPAPFEYHPRRNAHISLSSMTDNPIANTQGNSTNKSGMPPMSNVICSEYNIPCHDHCRYSVTQPCISSQFISTDQVLQCSPYSERRSPELRSTCANSQIFYPTSIPPPHPHPHRVHQEHQEGHYYVDHASLPYPSYNPVSYHYSGEFSDFSQHGKYQHISKVPTASPIQPHNTYPAYPQHPPLDSTIHPPTHFPIHPSLQLSSQTQPSSYPQAPMHPTTQPPIHATIHGPKHYVPPPTYSKDQPMHAPVHSPNPIYSAHSTHPPIYPTFYPPH